MNMVIQINKWGNSLGLRLPKEIVLQYRLDAGSQLKLKNTSDNMIILEPINKEFESLSEKYSLSNLVSKITEENKPDVDLFEDEPVGKEIW